MGPSAWADDTRGSGPIEDYPQEEQTPPSSAPPERQNIWEAALKEVVMPIAYTKHALTMLAERGIERAWVERTILEPASIEPDPKPPAMRAFRAVPERDSRVLRVVYVPDGET
jgi:hypothetical protein